MRVGWVIRYDLFQMKYTYTVDSNYTLKRYISKQHMILLGPVLVFRVYILTTAQGCNAVKIDKINHHP